jgi:hypothetical protein
MLFRRSHQTSRYNFTVNEIFYFFVSGLLEGYHPAANNDGVGARACVNRDVAA